MLLKDKYYKITNVECIDENNAVFHLELLPEAQVYQGHFPGRPVCPGACNVETIRECAEQFIGSQLSIDTISRCRFTAVATPSTCPSVDIMLNAIPNNDRTSYNVVGRIENAGTVFVEMKGEFRVR